MNQTLPALAMSAVSLFRQPVFAKHPGKLVGIFSALLGQVHCIIRQLDELSGSRNRPGTWRCRYWLRHDRVALLIERLRQRDDYLIGN